MKRTLAAALPALVFLACPAPAGASCAAPLPDVATAVAGAEVVFVGTVVGLADRGRWATFAVEEVWKGDVPERRLELRAGPADPPGDGMLATASVERTFTYGGRYLVFPSRGTKQMWGVPGGWVDNNCSSTTAYEPSMAGFRPATARIIEHPDLSARQPIEKSDSDDDGLAVAPLVVGVALLVAAGAGVVLAVRRRRLTS